MPQIHATAVSIEGQGVLLTGESGSGKSDLALRLIDRNARLVADDRCEVFAVEDQLNIAPPPQLEGMLEVRGVGIVVLQFEKTAPVSIVVEMTARDAVDRLPEALSREIEGIRLPLFKLDPFDVSAPEKVSMALKLVRGEIGSVA